MCSVLKFYFFWIGESHWDSNLVSSEAIRSVIHVFSSNIWSRVFAISSRSTSWAMYRCLLIVWPEDSRWTLQSSQLVVALLASLGEIRRLLVTQLFGQLTLECSSESKYKCRRTKTTVTCDVTLAWDFDGFF